MVRGILSTLFLCSAFGLSAVGQKPVEEWLTTADQAHLLDRQAPIVWQDATAVKAAIMVDDSRAEQTMDGFGHALTGGSAQLLMGMSPQARHALLEDLFSADGIATSYIRVSVGASDMNDHVYTYDDLEAGAVDPKLKRFSLAEDDRFVVPVLREILAINPSVKILASPWTAPAWMKTNDAVKGGELRKEFYPAYAHYWVLYLKGMKKRGIRIDTLTVQNEPENPKNTPSMVMTAEEQAEFIGKYLGPALHKAHLATKIVAFDHNCDHPIYPETVLKDADAAKYTDGSGFHLYRGEISALTQVHDAFPQKQIYFTEQMVTPGKSDAFPIARSVSRLIIAAPNNWSRNVLLWNLAADPQNGPHTSNGGCPVCTGAITIDGDHVKKLVAFYAAAHASKFVPAGSTHLATSGDAELPPHVAFRTPDGRHVLIVANPSDAETSFAIGFAGRAATASLAAGSVATFVW